MAAILLGPAFATASPAKRAADNSGFSSVYSTRYASADVNTVFGCERLFSLSGITGFVDSASYYERNLLDYSYPVQDQDCLDPYRQQVVKLPGAHTDVYIYLGSICIDGSGCVQKWLTPNGGHLALLHLGTLFTPYSMTYGLPSMRDNGPKAHGKTPDDTALAVGAASTLPTGFLAAQYHGGDQVAVSRWPDWAQYGNGYAGPQNAQLCVLYDQATLDWFVRVLNGDDVPRVVHHAYFRLKVWNSYRVAHRKRTISPYYCARRVPHCYTLDWAASFWVHHESLGGVKGVGHYYGSRRSGYTQTGFAHGVIRCWPLYHRCRAARR